MTVWGAGTGRRPGVARMEGIAHPAPRRCRRVVREMRPTRYGMEFVARVLESRPLTPSAHAIRVEKPPEFRFEPVQFTFLSLRTPRSPGWEDYRAMSLATSPTRPSLEYGARVGPSEWKQAFVSLEPGDEVMVEGPVGHFLLDPERPAVFVAGGIGITPLKGMAEYATDRDLPIPLRLVYSNRTQQEIAYRAELDALAGANPRLRVVHTLTRDDPAWTGRRGRVDEALLREASEGLEEAVFYVCGSPGMVVSVRERLAGMGVPPERVRYEEFWGY